MEIAVRVNNITKKYKLYEDKWGPIKEIVTRKQLHKEFLALDDISLDFPMGESIGILGTNGSGKSTLLKIITGITEPTNGDVEVNGSLVFLDVSSGIDGELSGYENIFMKGTLLGFSKEEMLKKVDDIIEFSELEEYIYQPVKTYSSGMRSKLGFAISVNVDPDILIVDEALAVGDAQFRNKCMDKMNSFKEEGKTIIFVSHDKNAVESFCTRAAWIHKGKLITYGDSKIVASYYNEFMSKKKSLDEIQNEIQFNHALEELSYEYSNKGISFNLRGYVYSKNTVNLNFEFIIRNIKTNQLISKPINEISYNDDKLLPEDIRKSAGFTVSFDKEELLEIITPGQYSFELGYNKDEKGAWKSFPVWAGKINMVNDSNQEEDGRFKYTFLVKDNRLLLNVDNHEKVDEQVNKIWFEQNMLRIEYVAYVRGYETKSAKDVASSFHLINLDTFEEYIFPSIVTETDEITENKAFNPQGKLYNFSKFNVSINLDNIPKGRYECKIRYKMNKNPYYDLLILVWATKNNEYPNEPYILGERKVDIQVKSKYLHINII